MKIKTLVTLLVLFCSQLIFAQKENAVWYFGDSAAVDFNSGMPVALNNSKLKAYTGCASICNAKGHFHLLFGIFTKQPKSFGL